jgi:hypothetical protein
MATAETWVTLEAYTNPMATTTVVGAAVIVLGHLVGALVMAAAGAAAAIRAGGTVPLVYPAVPMAVVAGLTAAEGITSGLAGAAWLWHLPRRGVSVDEKLLLIRREVHLPGANHDVRR